MMKVARMIAIFLAGAPVLALAGYMAGGWIDAARMSADLSAEADAIIAAGGGGDSLGDERLGWLLAVEDPNFYGHRGVDLKSPGAGITTITQSLAKRVAFREFKPGVAKARQTAFAVSLERHLEKEQILALALDRAEMGQSDEEWITGFHKASEVFFGAPPQDIQDTEFIRLVAVLIAPGKLNAASGGPALAERVRRIERLLASECAPTGNGDVWLEGCA